jgi:hypothetical protein
VEGGGWRVEGGGWRVEGGGWRVEGGRGARKEGGEGPDYLSWGRNGPFCQIRLKT